MNIIFTIIITLSITILTVTNPESILSTLLSGGEKAFELSLKLVIIYSVWMAIFKIMENSKLDILIAKAFRPFNKLLFGKIDNKSSEYISLNMSANILGISGATTPFGIKSIDELNKSNNDYAIAMFFVINATSIQLIPSSVLALRQSLGATNSFDIILPTIISTTISTIIGIVLVKIFIRKK